MHTRSLAPRAIGVLMTVGVLLVPTALASPARADRTGPALSLEDVTALETGGSVSVPMHLSVSSIASVEVRYTTRQRTARAGTDFTYTHGSVVFAPGETEQWIVVPIIDDRVPETTETFRVVIRGAIGATVADRRATATIHDDDWAGTPTLSPSTGLIHRQPVRIRARGLSAGLTVYVHECEGSVSAAHPYPGPCDAQLGGPIVVDAHGRIDAIVSVLRYFPFYDGIEYDCALVGCSLWLGIGAVDDNAFGQPVTLNFATPDPVPTISNGLMTVVV